MIGPLNVAAEYVDRISKGDIPAKITDNYNGDFNEIKNNLNQCIDAINGLIREATTLATAAAERRPGQQADDAQFQGKYRDIIHGMNKTLEGFATPVRDIGEVLKRMANKDFTAARSTRSIPAPTASCATTSTWWSRNIRAAIEQITESADQFAEGSRVIAESSQTLAPGAQDAELERRGDDGLDRGTDPLACRASRRTPHEADKVAKETNQLAEEGGAGRAEVDRSRWSRSAPVRSRSARSSR